MENRDPPKNKCYVIFDNFVQVSQRRFFFFCGMEGKAGGTAGRQLGEPEEATASHSPLSYCVRTL